MAQLRVFVKQLSANVPRQARVGVEGKVKEL
jgi:hypothetical protein